MRALPATITRAHFIILALSFINIGSTNILTDIPKTNPFNIDWDPAPSPEDGPPLSAGASRDTKHLRIEISGIVGAYLLCVLFTSIGIAIVRKKRKRNLKAGFSDIEMTQPRPLSINTQFFGELSPGLKSPSRNFSRPSWPAQEKDLPTPNVFPGTATSADRSPQEAYSPRTPASIEHPNVDTRVVERDQHMLQRDLEDIYAHVMKQEEAKAAGVAVEKLPPPPFLQAAGPVPSASQRGNSPQKLDKRRPSNIETAGKGTSRSSSLLSAILSPRKSRKMRISSPMGSPTTGRWQAETSGDENEPLTPRYNNIPPPPPVPQDQVAYVHTRKSSNTISPASPTRSIAQQLNTYGPDSTSTFHRNNPSRASVTSSQPEPGSVVSASSGIVPFASAGVASNAPRQLPFRSFEPALTSPRYESFQQATKTTVLERMGKSNGPRTGGLATPWSAGAVPYSPYQPFSPMIPVTPTLVTREERKRREKMERKSKLPATANDLVKSEEDLWDSGY
ncbi:hypothetical protein BJ878DRAFT_130320 [Calycina marina]|uniref:Uncharacterized protein n=1 Tax=Calycina marina TaxID=1763456 RepID=A0A9P7Z1K2_9HELO|nr:hypothetical protein BJ878DRAFT_130320 [Calycina marina]